MSYINQLRKEWDNSITYHPPRTEDQRKAHERVNELIKHVGNALLEVVPGCEQTEFMLQCLQEARMWANAGLAVHVNNPNRDKED